MQKEKVWCYNNDCEYCSGEMCDVDNTNCRVHEGYELLDGDCKNFKRGEENV